MAASDVVISHLQSARQELADQRAELDRTIADLDRLLEQYGSAEVHRSSDDLRQNRSPVMRDVIAELLASEDRDFATYEVVGQLERRYGWNSASIRSLLVRMAKEGSIDNVRRGYYKARAPQNAKDSAATTAESLVVPDRAIKEGGGANGTETPRDHDDDPSWQAIHRGHDLGAPVVGAP